MIALGVYKKKADGMREKGLEARVDEKFASCSVDN